MRIKRVNRYYCDFCSKSGCSAGHMKSHESHCTMNPNRRCKMCRQLGNIQKDINYLTSLLPLPSKFPPKILSSGIIGEIKGLEDYSVLTEEVKRSLPLLRDAANDCPVCIFSALRLRGIPMGIIDFDLKQELKETFNCLTREYESHY